MQTSIKLRLPGGSIVSVSVHPSMLINELLKIATLSSQSVSGIALLSGFPPIKRCSSVGEHSPELLVDALFKAGEIITVQCLAAGSSPLLSVAPSSPPLSTSTSSSSLSSAAAPSSPPLSTSAASNNDIGRDQHYRASKAKASENITAEIEAEKEREKKKVSIERKRKREREEAAAATLLASVKASSNTKKKAKLNFGPGEGQRLGSDTTTIAPMQSPPQSLIAQKASPVRRQRINLASSEKGMAEKLISALDGAGSTKKDGGHEYLQKVAQSALNQQYEITNAGDRVAAAMAGLFSFEPISSGRTLSSGDCVQLRVRYKPSQKKKFVEEIIDNLPMSALAPLFEMLVKGEGSSEATRASLRPHEMARLSIRTFWAVVRFGGPLFRHETPPGVNDATLIGIPTMPTQCLEAICPSIDWSFLEERSKRLSEKALKNSQADTRKVKKVDVSILSSVVDSKKEYTSSSATCVAADVVDTGMIPSVEEDGEIHYSEPAHATLETLVLSSMVSKEFLKKEEVVSLSNCVKETLSRLKLKFFNGLSHVSSSMPTIVDDVFDVQSLITTTFESPEISLVMKHDPYKGHREVEKKSKSTSFEIETFICEDCSKARIICSDEEDLDAIRAAEKWTCGDAKIGGRLYRRGACNAPDDDLCEIIGSEDAATCCDALQLRTVSDVASALMLPLDELLFSGHVGPLTLPFLKSRCTQLSSSSSSLSSSSSSLSTLPLASSLINKFVETATTLGLIDEVPQNEEISARPVTSTDWQHVLRKRLPQPQVLQAYMTLDSSKRQSLLTSLRGLHIGKYGIKLSLQEYRIRGHLLLLAAAQQLLPKSSRESTDDAALLLLHPLGLVATYAVAQSWQAFARADTMAELLTSAIQCDSILESSMSGSSSSTLESNALESNFCTSMEKTQAVLEALTELGIQTPADLAMIDASVLFSTLRSRGEIFNSLKQSSVELWNKNIKSLLISMPWLSEIITEA